MSEETQEPAATIHEFTEKGRETLENAQSGARNALATATDYIRANPWTAVAGAAIVGGVLAALTAPRPSAPHQLDAVRDWLAETYEKLPSQKQVQSSLAKGAGLPEVLTALRRKLGF